MPKIYMIRHGEASASFTSDKDPGLSSLGHSQSEQAAENLQHHTISAIYSSPLRRAQETAMPLAALRSKPIIVEPRVAEVPSEGLSLEDRGPWLTQVMQGRWQDQSESLLQWRADMAAALIACTEDCAIFSHFVAINSMVALATDADEVLVFRPNNASITTFSVTDGRLSLDALGESATTQVN